MKSYIVYDSDGIIVRTGVCSQHDLHLQAIDGQFVIEGEADDASKMIVDGKIVDKPETIYTEAELSNQVLKSIRATRRNKLAESDWTQFGDSPLTDKKKAEWATYRQALRDLPQEFPNAISNDDIIWPTKPR
tara:strand:+ start:617 stop:1012 length:396 start_codon:yes stop_codon:yes gene_type:complete